MPYSRGARFKRRRALRGESPCKLAVSDVQVLLALPIPGTLGDMEMSAGLLVFHIVAIIVIFAAGYWLGSRSD